MTDRDPINAEILGAAVTQWLDQQNWLETTDEQEIWDNASHEFDVALEAVLLAQGVISPADAIESFESCITGIGDRIIIACLEDGAELSLYQDGHVNMC